MSVRSKRCLVYESACTLRDLKWVCCRNVDRNVASRNHDRRSFELITRKLREKRGTVYVGFERKTNSVTVVSNISFGHFSRERVYGLPRKKCITNKKKMIYNKIVFYFQELNWLCYIWVVRYKYIHFCICKTFNVRYTAIMGTIVYSKIIFLLNSISLLIFRNIAPGIIVWKKRWFLLCYIIYFKTFLQITSF